MPKTDCFLVELRDKITISDHLAPAISEWSIGMHIQHCCKVTSGICRALIESSPPPPTSRTPLMTHIVFWTGRIPRGRGRAPSSVRPSEGVTAKQLDELLGVSAGLLAQTAGLTPDAWFKHFGFGVLRRDNAIRFIGIHNRHHLRIISDIEHVNRESV